MYSKGILVKSYLATHDIFGNKTNDPNKAYDLTKAVTDWNALQKYTAATNSTAQVRMKQAEASVEQSVQKLQQFSDDYIRSGYKFVNKADLVASSNGVFGEDAAKKAQAILGQISLITDELGQTFMGGNSPTDAAFALAANVLKGDFTQEVMTSQIDLLKQNLQYRKNSWNQVTATGLGGDNIYNQSTPETVSSATTWCNWDT